MPNNFWNDEEEFRDVPDEAQLDENGNYKQSVVPQFASQQRPRPQQPIQAPVVEEHEFDVDGIEIEEDYTVVLSDARLRLEQGKLYELIMNNDIFDGVDADPIAVKHVQREVRKFAKESMEVMLGMRQTTPAHSKGIVSSPFNDLEVTILKKLASKATNGATESEDANQTAAVINKPAPKKQTLSSIGSKPAQKPAPQKAKPLASGPQKPLTRKPVTEEQWNNPNIPVEYEEPLNKRPSDMSAEDLIARSKRIAERQAQNKAALPQNALPMPSPEQEAMLYQHHAMNLNPSIQAIVSKLQSTNK